MNLFAPQQPVAFLPRRAIEAFTQYVLIEEAATDGVDITQYAVQRGAPISDHASLKPAVLKIKAIFDKEVTQEPLAETYRKLLALRARFEPFTVVTGKRQYENMLIQNLDQLTDETSENTLAINLDLLEVRIVDVQTVAVPAREKHANPNKTGGTSKAGQKSPKNTSPGGDDASNSSVLERRLGGTKFDEWLDFFGL